MNPNQIIAALLDIADAAFTLNHGSKIGTAMDTPVDTENLEKLENALAVLNAPEGEGHPIALARIALSTFTTGVQEKPVVLDASCWICADTGIAFGKVCDCQTPKVERRTRPRMVEAKTPDRNGHDLYTTADADRPAAICDRNGEVVLGMCKTCGRAEIELDEPCSVKEKCAFCGATVTDPCDEPPPDTCEKALNATYGDPLTRKTSVEQKAVPDAEAAFAFAFKGYQYGPDETSNAKHWFCAGYRAGVDSPLEAATIGSGINTMFTIATDSEGKAAVRAIRSTFDPNLDYSIMESALAFEQAKRLRGVEIKPHKVGHLWMTTISMLPYQVREIGEEDWRDATLEEYSHARAEPQMDTRINPEFIKDRPWIRSVVFDEMRARLALPVDDENAMTARHLLNGLNQIAFGDTPIIYPAELNKDLRDILGTMCFSTIKLMPIYRGSGFDIPPKAEEEQAFTIDRMLRAYFKSGDKWAATFNNELRELHAALRAKIAAKSAEGEGS